MVTMLNFAILAIATMFTIAASAAFSWISLRVTFRLMQPATARRTPACVDLARGTAQPARAFSGRR